MSEPNYATELREIARSNNIRFVLDLEFVELLAKPYYLQFLAYNRYFTRPAFINYIEYLQYFHKPEYAMYVQHPHALYFLTQLLEPQFRAMLSEPIFIHTLATQQRLHWRTFRSQRMLEAQQAQAEKAGSTAEMASVMLPAVSETVNPFLLDDALWNMTAPEAQAKREDEAKDDDKQIEKTRGSPLAAAAAEDQEVHVKRVKTEDQ